VAFFAGVKARILKKLAFTPAKNATKPNANHFATAHKKREQSGDRRNDGESNCNFRDGTGQMAQPWMFMMMMMMTMNYCVVLIVVSFP
jgi:hypothetical protein